MSEQITIWHVGNTGLRNPNRIQEGFSVFADSPFVGNLREENEVAFMKYLNEKGIIQKLTVLERYILVLTAQLIQGFMKIGGGFFLMRTDERQLSITNELLIVISQIVNNL